MGKVCKMVILVADMRGVIDIHTVLGNFEFLFQEFNAVFQMCLFTRLGLETSFVGKVFYETVDLSMCIANVLLCNLKLSDI